MKTLKITHVYEAVDQTNDEMYWQVGVWLDLRTAISEIEKYADNPHPLDYHDSMDGGHFQINIHQREIGFGFSTGKCVCSFIWQEKYDTEHNKYVWRLTKNSILETRQFGRKLADKSSSQILDLSI